MSEHDNMLNKILEFAESLPRKLDQPDEITRLRAELERERARADENGAARVRRCRP